MTTMCIVMITTLIVLNFFLSLMNEGGVGGWDGLLMWLLVEVNQVIQSAVASVSYGSLKHLCNVTDCKAYLYIYIYESIFLSPFLLLCPFERECHMNSEKDIKK